MPTPSLLSSAHARSGLYALIFSPIALVLLGSSMVDVQGQTALGQPLASVEGLIGMALASILLALISMNCEDSPAGMIVTSVVSLFIGAAQFTGLLRIPLLQSTNIDALDMRAAVAWSLYPVSVTVIAACAAIAIALAQRQTSAVGADTARRVLREYRHAWVTSAVLPLALLTVVLVVMIAPDDTTAVAAHGLSGLSSSHPLALAYGMVIALVFGCITLMSVHSLTGPQLVAWIILVIPGYMLVPLWTSLTGQVATPGHSLSTQVSLAAPVLTALGLVLATTSVGVHWARPRPVAAPEDEGNAAADEGSGGAVALDGETVTNPSS